MEDNKKTRYSDEELEEFRIMIDQKIAESQKQLSDLREQMTELNENDESNRSDAFEDGASNWQREHLNKLAARAQKFIRDLEYALIRIKNKTYGICNVTGQLIDKKRLLLVPHATKSIEGKLNENEDTKVVRKPISSSDIDKKNQPQKKIISKIISPKKKNDTGYNLDEDGEDDDFSLPEENLNLDGLLPDDHE
jgi:DnaK suppressor protein